MLPNNDDELKGDELKGHTRASHVGGTLQVALNFYSHSSDGGLPYSTFGPQRARSSGPMSNIVSTPHVVELLDMRGQESAFELDLHGFVPLGNVPSLATDLLDEHGEIADLVGDTLRLVTAHVDAVVRGLIPSTESLSIFTTMTRSSNPHNSAQSQRRPSPLIHIDHTPTSGASFLTKFPPDIQNDIQSGRLRVRILSVWQPLVPKVLDWPLALADARTCPPTALLDSETRLAHGNIGAMSLMTYDPTVQWWYWSSMTHSEVLVIKNYDSKDSQGRTPHTSFFDPRSVSSPGVFRKSVEARVIVASTM